MLRASACVMRPDRVFLRSTGPPPHSSTYISPIAMDHPPPNLLGLPAELKARIVEMVHGQEEAWQERQRHQGDEDEVNHINCLAALSLVNKEIHGMACRHIFEVRISHS